MDRDNQIFLMVSFRGHAASVVGGGHTLFHVVEVVVEAWTYFSVAGSLEVLVSGILVAVHLHVGDVALLGAGGLIDLNESLEIKQGKQDEVFWGLKLLAMDRGSLRLSTVVKIRCQSTSALEASNETMK